MATLQSPSLSLFLAFSFSQPVFRCNFIIIVAYEFMRVITRAGRVTFIALSNERGSLSLLSLN